LGVAPFYVLSVREFKKSLRVDAVFLRQRLSIIGLKARVVGWGMANKSLAAVENHRISREMIENAPLLSKVSHSFQITYLLARASGVHQNGLYSAHKAPVTG
jgi:hypothetical protein